MAPRFMFSIFKRTPRVVYLGIGLKYKACILYSIWTSNIIYDLYVSMTKRKIMKLRENVRFIIAFQ